MTNPSLPAHVMSIPSIVYVRSWWVLPYTDAKDCENISDPPTSYLFITTAVTVSCSPPMTPGLDNATVTPGSAAPDESSTDPPIAPTPCAAAGAHRSAITAARRMVDNGRTLNEGVLISLSLN